MSKTTTSTICALLLGSFSFALPVMGMDSTPPHSSTTGGAVKGGIIGGLGGAAVGHPALGAAAGATVGAISRHHKKHKMRKQAEEAGQVQN